MSISLEVQVCPIFLVVVYLVQHALDEYHTASDFPVVSTITSKHRVPESAEGIIPLLLDSVLADHLVRRPSEHPTADTPRKVVDLTHCGVHHQVPLFLTGGCAKEKIVSKVLYNRQIVPHPVRQSPCPHIL